MTQYWLLTIALLPAGFTLCQDLVTLCCYVARRASIERIIARATGRMLLLDSSADGAKLVVEVQPAVAMKSSVPAAKDHAE